MFDRLIDLVISSLDLFRFWYVVECYEEGIVLRLGKMARRVGPGLHFRWPLAIENELTTNVLERTSDIGIQSLTTKDGVSVGVSVIVTWEISDIEAFFIKVDGADEFMADRTCGAVSDFVCQKQASEILAGELLNEVGKVVRREAKQKGIHIHRVQLRDFVLRSRSLRIWTSAVGHNLKI